jgi:4-hydroxythreonine-4-phosphate dehydrogenase
MFHDQGHVAAKMLGIWLGVNVTLGLPIIRTSVEHGTSYDKAGTGTADPRSMNGALRLASTMALSRKAATVGS